MREEENVGNLGRDGRLQRRKALIPGRTLPLLARKEGAILLDTETGKSKYATDKGTSTGSGYNDTDKAETRIMQLFVYLLRPRNDALFNRSHTGIIHARKANLQSDISNLDFRKTKAVIA